MIHSTLPPGQVNRATVHATVSEFWHVLHGEGEIWRREAGQERVTRLAPGVSIDIPVDIPVGTAFQYRAIGDAPLIFLCISMPPWPGDHEATHLARPLGAHGRLAQARSRALVAWDRVQSPPDRSSFNRRNPARDSPLGSG